MDLNFDHQMSLSKSKCWYSNNCLYFLNVLFHWVGRKNHGKTVSDRDSGRTCFDPDIQHNDTTQHSGLNCDIEHKRHSQHDSTWHKH